MIIFESLRKRANRFLFVLGLLGIFTVASIILTAIGVNLLLQIQTQIQVDEEVADSDIDALDSLGSYETAIGIFWIGAYVVCAVLFLMWKHEAPKNLALLGVSNQRFPPWRAVAYYFVPISGLFRPYQVMKEIYLRSRMNAFTPSYSILTIW